MGQEPAIKQDLVRDCVPAPQSTLHDDQGVILQPHPEVSRQLTEDDGFEFPQSESSPLGQKTVRDNVPLPQVFEHSDHADDMPLALAGVATSL